MSDWQCHGRISGRCPCALCQPTYINSSHSSQLQSVRSPMPMLPSQAPFLSSSSSMSRDLWYRSGLLAASQMANSAQHSLGKDSPNYGHYRPSALDRRFSYRSAGESLHQSFPPSTVSSLQIHPGAQSILPAPHTDSSSETEHYVRPKRVRTVFTPEQLERLEHEFRKQQYISSVQRVYLSAELGLSEAQVKVWFQNRRIRWRKQLLEKKSKC